MFVDEGGASCSACSITNCMDCENHTHCVQCDEGNNFYADNGVCQYCNNSIDEFLDNGNC